MPIKRSLVFKNEATSMERAANPPEERKITPKAARK